MISREWIEATECHPIEGEDIEIVFEATDNKIHKRFIINWKNYYYKENEKDFGKLIKWRRI